MNEENAPLQNPEQDRLTRIIEDALSRRPVVHVNIQLPATDFDPAKLTETIGKIIKDLYPSDTPPAFPELDRPL